MVGFLGGPYGWSPGLGLGVGLVAGLVAGRGARGGGSPAWIAPLRWRQLFSRSSLMTALTAGLAGGLVFGLLFGLLLELEDAPMAGLKLGVAIGLALGLVTGLVTGLGESAVGSPARMALLQLRQMISASSLMAGLAAGLVTALAFGFYLELGAGFGLGIGLRLALGWAAVDGLTVGFLVWLVFGLGTVLSTGLTRPEVTDTSPLTPLASWRRDKTSSLVAGLAGGLTAGLLLGLISGLVLGTESGSGIGLGSALVQGLSFGLAIGLPAGLMFGLAHSETWAVSLAFVQLARRQRTPVRLMRFLEDARERQVLRTVGPVYQFRHARLQDRLASQASTTTRPDHSRGAFEEAHHRPGPGR
jgi:hypothetical protein